MFQQTTKLEENKSEDEQETLESFNATNYKSLMRYCILLNKLVGFLYSETKLSRYVLSKLRISFSTIWTVIFMSFFLLSMYEINYHRHFDDSSELLHYNFILILSPVIVLPSYILNRSTVRMVRNMARLADQLSPETFRKLAKGIYVKDAFRFLPFIAYLPISFLSNRSFFACFTWYSFLAAMAVNALYVNNVYVLKACYERINDSLIKICEMLIKGEPHRLRRMYQWQDNPMLLKELRTLKKQHLQISRVNHLLNETYGMQNIGILWLLFIDISFNVYHNIVLFTNPSMIMAHFTTLITFVAYYSLNLILTVWTIEIARDQVQMIGSNIHRIITNTFNEQATIELELFSLQVLQCNDGFLAMGLPMDATLLTKLVSSIVTYVLILIQFLLVKSC